MEALFIDNSNCEVLCAKLPVFLPLNCFVKLLGFIADIFNELTHSHTPTRTYK